MKFYTPEPTQITSNSTIPLVNMPLRLMTVSIIMVNPTMNATVQIYDQSGHPLKPLKFTSGVRMNFKFIDYSKIVLSDPNNYNVALATQTMVFDNSAEMNKYMSEANLDIVPIDSIIIISPLDPNGYLETDDVGLNSKVVKLNQDSSGNLGVNIENNVNIGNTPNVALTQNPSAYNITYTTSSTANTSTQLDTDTTYRDEITIYAPSSNSANVLIGTSSSQTFPIAPNSSLTLKKTNVSLWYAQSSSASQTLYIIAGGS